MSEFMIKIVDLLTDLKMALVIHEVTRAWTEVLALKLDLCEQSILIRR